MKVSRVENEKETLSLTTKNLRVGDIGLTKEGFHILRTYDGFVNLENPTNTWEDSANFNLFEILKKGDSVLLTIE